MVPQGLSPGNDPLPQSVAIHAPRCRGAVVGGVARALQPLFEVLPATAGLTVVKHSTVRTVLSGAFDDVHVHLKIHRAITLSDRARDVLRGNRGTREASNLLRAAALDLPVAEPLACGSFDDADRGSRTFLLTRTIEGAQPFTFDLPAETLQHTGRLLRRMHDRGFLPGDLHPGNVVVDGRGQPWLLDLSSVRQGGEPSILRRAEALATFCQPLDAGPVDEAARPLLLAYLAAGRELPDQFAVQLVLAARAMRHRALISFGRRWSRNCRHTVVPPKRRGELRFHFHQVEDEVDREPLHAACREFAEAPPSADKEGRRGAVWLLPELAIKEREQGAARRLFLAMYWLKFAGVSQPEPVALASNSELGYVFARRLPLPSLAFELDSGALGGEDLLGAARKLGASVGRLHAHGLRNRDLKFENLVRDPSTGEVCMVDLDGVRRKRTDDTRGQGADLGRLLAAFVAAGSPGGNGTAIAFVRAYLRSRRALLQPAPMRRIWHTAGKRAKQWASAHRI